MSTQTPFGNSVFNITSSALGVNFTPSTPCRIYYDKDKVKIKEAYSPFTNYLNVKVIENYSLYKIVVKNITVDDWYYTFNIIKGQELEFTPNTDAAAIVYDVKCVSVRPLWGNEISFLSEDVVIELVDKKYTEETISS